MTLWVDVDGTLVLWPGRTEDGKWDRRKGRANTPLIKAIHQFLLRNRATLVVWSSMGQAYAESFGNQLLGDLTWYAAERKDGGKTRRGDIMVDDEIISGSGRRMHPSTFIRQYGGLG